MLPSKAGGLKDNSISHSDLANRHAFEKANNSGVKPNTAEINSTLDTSTSVFSETRLAVLSRRLRTATTDLNSKFVSL